MKKVLFCTMCFFFLFPAYVLGKDLPVTTREEWKPDEQITKIEESYREPKKIALVPVQIPLSFASVSDDILIKDYYYYFATRSSYGDVPFHYLIAPSGKIYQTAKFSDFTKIPLEGLEDSIVIGILSTSSNQSLPISTLDAASSLTATIANNFGIDSKNITMYIPDFVFNAAHGVENIAFKKSGSEFTIDTVREYAKSNFKPNQSSFQFEIMSLSVPDGKVKTESEVTITLTIKNTSSRDVFTDESSQLVLQSKAERSAFYKQDSWATFSTVSLLENGERFPKGEEKTISISALSPLAIGTYTEEFELFYKGSSVSKSSTLSISLENPGGTVIEILETGAGYLNVRSQPPFGEVITQVLTGEKYIVLEEQVGWYKIRTKDGKEGWVSTQYTKKISS